MIFALSIHPLGEPQNADITTVSDLVIENRDDLAGIVDALRDLTHAAKAGDWSKEVVIGGGAAAAFVLRAVHPRDVVDGIEAMYPEAAS